MAGTPPEVRDRAVAAIAQLLGDPTGRCPHCGRLTRLVADGRLPEHAPTASAAAGAAPAPASPRR